MFRCLPKGEACAGSWNGRIQAGRVYSAGRPVYPWLQLPAEKHCVLWYKRIIDLAGQPLRAAR